MSVKKSLWLSGALVMAFSLLFLGCPTEAESSSETVSYQKTALWAAVVAAETDLNSAFVSVDGNDVAKAEKWVTSAQYAAFKGAIGEAQAVAYTLGRAVEATPAEEPAIAALTTARNTFDGQKKPGGAEPASVASLTGGGTGNIIVTGNENVGLAIGGGVVTVAPGAKLSVSGTVNVTGGEIKVKEGGTFEVADGISLTGFAGAITVESGATSIDKKPGGGSLISSGGSYVISAGATVIVNSSTFGSYRDVVLVGPSSGNNRGEVLQLTSGTITIAATSYSLDGNATLVAEHSVKTDGLNISDTSILTVDGGTLLWDNTDVPGGSSPFGSSTDPGAKIILRDAKASIIVLNTKTQISVAPIAITGVEDGGWTYSGPSGGYYRATLSGPAVLVYGSSGWAKQ
jgi:hypothetical protein